MFQLTAPEITAATAYEHIARRIGEGEALINAHLALRNIVSDAVQAGTMNTITAGDVRASIEEAVTRAKQNLAELERDALRADTLYSHKMHTFVEGTSPNGVPFAELIADASAKVDRKMRVAGAHAHIGWLTWAHGCTAEAAVAVMATAVSQAVDEGRVSPSRRERVLRNVESAAQAHNVRFRW
ncbi:hypothetical protein ACWEQ4_00815 [Rhodococcus sp. NPDC003994]